MDCRTESCAAEVWLDAPHCYDCYFVLAYSPTLAEPAGYECRAVCASCGVYEPHGGTCTQCARKALNAGSVASMLGGYGTLPSRSRQRPSAEAWAAACNLRRRGDYYVGACPLCREGDDRFFVHAETAVVSCRRCYDGRRTWFRDAIEAAGL